MECLQGFILEQKELQMKKLGTVELFPTVLGVYEFNNLDHDKIEKELFSIKEENLGRSDTDLIFQTYGNLHEIPILSDLNQHVIDACFDYLKTHFYKFSKSEMYIANCWATVSKDRACTHRSHIHRNTLLSAVYFLKTPPGSGKLYFIHPNISNEMLRLDEDQIDRLNWLEYLIDPQPGLCVVFKSSTLHGVEQNFFDNDLEERISIAYTMNVSNIGKYSDLAKS
jgi:uncharacterized protein (TIGR02466 family)